jgi:hypothetical protein
MAFEGIFAHLQTRNTERYCTVRNQIYLFHEGRSRSMSSRLLCLLAILLDGVPVPPMLMCPLFGQDSDSNRPPSPIYSCVKYKRKIYPTTGTAVESGLGYNKFSYHARPTILISSAWGSGRLIWARSSRLVSRSIEQHCSARLI